MEEPQITFERERRQMVAGQILNRGIRDPKILSVFSKVPRDRFVPEEHRMRSYTDHPLPIGEGQTISQPYIVALMMELLHPEPDSRVLEIGTGSGYQTALLAEIASKVYSIERIPVLAERASRLLKDMGYANVEIRVGDGSLGWPEAAPFDRILVAAAAPSVPKSLAGQLAEGGRLVVPIGSALEQTLTLVERVQGNLRLQEGCSCLFVPLIGAEGS
ncbi:MAG: protein-L-isoaspartate(D-aspartate) O-methyltransferase [Candidatus Omnitrophica bacterium]|nr:protein-L-isoaspartate(D-aspartate) O-methyltransferase [Candidatus Omnitrophota bacterium]